LHKRSKKPRSISLAGTYKQIEDIVLSLSTKKVIWLMIYLRQVAKEVCKKAETGHKEPKRNFKH
jgi:hypothetical protein